MVLAASHVCCWQGQTPLHMLPYGSDEDRQEAILALLCSYNTDLNAQDGKVSPCTCASFQKKVMKHIATRQRLSDNSSMYTLNAFATL